jgi:hypothetical protein
MANWFKKLAGQRKKISNQSGEMNVVDELPFSLEKSSGLISSDRTHVISEFRKGVENQLKILQAFFECNICRPFLVRSLG